MTFPAVEYNVQLHKHARKLQQGQGLLFACWVILHAFLSSADAFQNQHFRKNLSGLPSESNRFDSGQAQHFVGPDLIQTVWQCLQRLSAKHASRQSVKSKCDNDKSQTNLHTGSCSKFCFYVFQWRMPLCRPQSNCSLWDNLIKV